MTFLRHLKDLIAFMGQAKNDRHIVFYSEGAHDWNHLKGIIDTLLKSTDVAISYISSQDTDPGMNVTHAQFKSFKTDEGSWRTWLFRHMNVPIVVMTTPDLNQFQLKKSVHPVRYVYVQHALVSLHTVYRKAAFDHYDVIFCAGPHHVQEVKAMEAYYGLKPKKLVEHGYGRLDALLGLNAYKLSTEQKEILIAPSWGPYSILNQIGNTLIEILLSAHYKVTVRPHPQTCKLHGEVIRAIEQTFRSHAGFNLSLDMSADQTLQSADLMISDWSGATLDFALGLDKPVIFIDLPQKINNPEHALIGEPAFESVARREIGTLVSPEHLMNLPNVIEGLIGKSNKHIQAFREQHVFNVGTSDRVGADVLLTMLNKRCLTVKSINKRLKLSKAPCIDEQEWRVLNNITHTIKPSVSPAIFSNQTRTVDITVLFYESTIARAYLETMRSLGIKPRKIIHLVSTVNLKTKKPLRALLPKTLKTRYAEWLQKHMMHYWVRFIGRKYPELKSGILKTVVETLGFSEEMLTSAQALLPLTDYCDHVETAGVESLSDPVLEQILGKEQGTLLFTGGGMLPAVLIALRNIQFIHIHPGFLPSVKGADGVFWSLLMHGQLGASAFYMSERIDAGDIILSAWLPRMHVAVDFGKYDDQVIYRAVYAFLDPWVRAFVLRELLVRFDDVGCLPSEKQSDEGEMYYFMHPLLRAEALKFLGFRSS